MRAALSAAGSAGAIDWLVGRAGGRSGGRGQRSDALERFDERPLPGPAGGQPQCEAPRAADEAAGQCEQPAADGARGADRLAGQAEQVRPAQQVVGDRSDHRPGGVGGELARREMRERLVL